MPRNPCITHRILKAGAILTIVGRSKKITKFDLEITDKDCSVLMPLPFNVTTILAGVHSTCRGCVGLKQVIGYNNQTHFGFSILNGDLKEFRTLIPPHPLISRSWPGTINLAPSQEALNSVIGSQVSRTIVSVNL
jgi:hypothetical protein